jgi:N-acetyl-anhydromuramyl-L-alanine amidase AmpD
MRRRIRKIVLHCSAVRPNQSSSAKQIDLWHRRRGWKGIGYHYVIRRDGSIENGRSEDDVGAHCQGHNQDSIGVVYEGGLDEHGHPADTRTPEQREAMEDLLEDLLGRYSLAKVYTHHHFNKNKACPCFEY